MSPPPGNKGGAVSGAGPCALTEVHTRRSTMGRRPIHRAMQNRFRSLTNASSNRNGEAKAHEYLCRNTTGGQTRCGGVLELRNSYRAGRGIVLQQSEQTSLCQVRQKLAALRIQKLRRKLDSQTRAARTERASRASSCNNLDRDVHATSKASSHSTASPVRG